MKNWLHSVFSGQSRMTDASEQKSSQSLIAVHLAGHAQWTPRDYGALAREGYQRNAIVYRCIRMVSEGAASIPLCVKRAGQCEAGDPAAQLLARPHAQQSSAELMEALYGYLQVSGNAYLEAGLWQGAPQFVVLDIPSLDVERSGPLIGAYAQPWRPVSITVATGAPQTLDVNAPCYVGTLLSTLSESFKNHRDFSITAQIELEGVALSSLEDIPFFAGGNAIALEASHGWEVLQFQTATLIGPSTYEISGFLRGQSGTVVDMAVQGGAKIVWLGSGLQTVPLTSSLRGADIEVAVDISGRATPEQGSFSYNAVHLQPRAPVQLRAGQELGELTLSWIRQTRIGGDDWASVSIPLSETEERYEVEFYSNDNLLFLRQTPSPSLSLNAFDLASYPQLLQQGASVKVYQMSLILGRGTPLEESLGF